ncbi:MAG: transposase [Phycisphaeraceae bacterium]|nr:transposase [Phycisphaeraceae bacterium]
MISAACGSTRLEASALHQKINLDDNAREIVDSAIRERCAFTGAALHALNVRTNHVHAVVTLPGHPPERIMHSLKSWATRALKTMPGHASRTHFWTRHGSTRHLWDDRALVSACEYVVLRQDGRESGAGRG